MSLPDAREGEPPVLVDPRRIELVATYYLGPRDDEKAVRIGTRGGHTMIVAGTVESVKDKIVEALNG